MCDIYTILFMPFITMSKTILNTDFSLFLCVCVRSIVCVSFTLHAHTKGQSIQEFMNSISILFRRNLQLTLLKSNMNFHFVWEHVPHERNKSFVSAPWQPRGRFRSSSSSNSSQEDLRFLFHIEIRYYYSRKKKQNKNIHTETQSYMMKLIKWVKLPQNGMYPLFLHLAHPPRPTSLALPLPFGIYIFVRTHKSVLASEIKRIF